MGDGTEMSFEEAVRRWIAGDFSRLAPLFRGGADGAACRVVEWFDRGLFAGEPAALAEALSCACFNGCVDVVQYLLARGVDPSGGAGTGMNAFHWAANRGQLAVVRALVETKAPLETKNAYGGTVLDCAVWSALHEPKPEHVAIIEALLEAGADVRAVRYPTGHEGVDRVLMGHGAGAR